MFFWHVIQENVIQENVYFSSFYYYYLDCRAGLYKQNSDTWYGVNQNILDHFFYIHNLSLLLMWDYAM